MQVLVCGGAGYIGSHTAKLLAQRGHTPVVYDDLSNGHAWAAKFGPFEEGSLADRERLREVFARHRIEAVVHFAAFIQVGESVQQPAKYYRNNFVNTLNLLETMVEAGVRDIIFSSTAATYGMPEQMPIPETEKQLPINPYGESKLFVEYALRAFAQAHGTRWVVFRYFNAAGADPDGEIGEDHTPESHLIPLVIQAALGQRPHISVFGTDYETPDGTCVRDYVHICDLAEAHVTALGYLQGGGESIALNLGTGEGYSVREVIQAVERVSGKPVPVSEQPRRDGDSPSLVADARRARQVLGWEPKLSRLDDIVRTAWRWHASRA
ncbi:MAG: UDP-glucose 4-epimerase GalE [Bryobacteraceae bacterium]|nr:UDP-glucose 4-epimerase GalE [Bryobacteraceae bacterium]